MRTRAVMAALMVMFVVTAGSARAQQQGKIELQWLGQAAVKLTSVAGKVIVIDPFLTNNPKTPAQYKNLDALGKVDLILVTHAHGDHLGDAPDLILVPIGGHFVMNPQDAAVATREYLKPKHAIPIHYGTFPVLRGTPEEYVRALGQTPTKVHAISPGDKLTF